MSSNSNNPTIPGAKILQERLHELLTKLAGTIELIKNWKESGEDPSVHFESTTKLIASIKQVIASVQKVDGVVKSDTTLRKNLQDCLIPLDLLDLLDHGGGINPDCFSRSLLKEAQGQLAGLKRRKLALEMLGRTVEQGLKKREAQEKAKERKKSKSPDTSSNKKRSRSKSPDNSSKRKRSDSSPVRSSSADGGGNTTNNKSPPSTTTTTKKASPSSSSSK